ncbi:flagellar motor switch protein FliG [Jannaschia rubra]|uniref:flagellar motor switch protein FliG n=1 Tax=Jannaschia rubra TaxID=282197 RepID=UPI0024914F9E|nr:FliG C-terminal domain-containing protein [Jannaschia rubra]
MSFPSLPARAPSAPLTPRQKAAVIIHLLVSGRADPGLRDLPPDQQRLIVREIARLRFIDRETLAGVVAEFASELDSIGLHFPRDPARVLAALESQLSLDVIDGMMAELGDTARPGDGPWAQIAGLDVAAIRQMMDGESDEVSAVLLSKLPAARAAEIIGSLPGDRADSIAAAFARTEDVTPAAVAQIGMALGRQSATRRTPAFDADGVKRVGNILNAATSGVRRSILDSLDAVDAAFAARVRATVFSYENIADRVDPRDLPRVLRGVENTVLVTAIAGTPPEMSAIPEFMLGAISKRLAEQLREEVAERSPPTAEEAETAMSAIVAVIRQMEEDGELILSTPET